MKKYLAVLAVAIGALLQCSPPVHAQSSPLNQTTHALQSLRDLTETSYVYCSTLGINGTGTDRNKPGKVRLAAGAGSTTVTGTGAFTNIAVGDVLYFNVGGVIMPRTVTARASADSITIETALSALALTNLPFEYRTLNCGTADNSGAIALGGVYRSNWQIAIVTFNATSIDYNLQCRIKEAGSAWMTEATANKTAVFAGPVEVTKAYSECRLGFKVNTDTGSNLITASVAIQK